MRPLPLILVILGLFMFSNLTAQDQHPVSEQTNLSNIPEEKYPEYQNTGNSKYDDLVFRKAVLDFAIAYRGYPQLEGATNPIHDIKQWNKENPLIAKDLKINIFRDYKEFLASYKNYVKPTQIQ